MKSKNTHTPRVAVKSCAKCACILPSTRHAHKDKRSQGGRIKILLLFTSKNNLLPLCVVGKNTTHFYGMLYVSDCSINKKFMKKFCELGLYFINMQIMIIINKNLLFLLFVYICQNGRVGNNNIRSVKITTRILVACSVLACLSRMTRINRDEKHSFRSLVIDVEKKC